MQLIKNSTASDKYKGLSIYQKLVTIVYSKEFISSIKELAYDPDRQSVIHLPEADGILDIIKKAIDEKNYQPYSLLEKRVIQGICIEKIIGYARSDNEFEILD